VRVRTFGWAVWLISLALTTGALCADGKLNVIRKFESGSLELKVATYLAAGGERIGLLSWRSAQARNAFAFRQAQWVEIFELGKKATRAQGREWKAIGAAKEIGSSDISSINIKGGAGVEIAVTSQKGASLAYVLPAADFARYEQAMREMKTFLDASPAKK